MKITYLKIEEVLPNDNNPRIITEARFSKLVKSLQDFPEMAKARPLIINQNNVVLGGNMRLKAMQIAGWLTVPTIKVDWTEEKQREFILRDNVSQGEWDWEILKSEFGMEELTEFGLELPTVDFNPNLTPSINTDAITSEDIEKAKKNMNIGNNLSETMEVICPNCAHEFHIKN